MKILHLSDLHIGKRVNEFSMIEDQKYILNQVIDIIKKQKIEIVLIAGDIYDKSIPPTEAVSVFDDFIYELKKMEVKVLAISGNHDSQERLAFCSRILDDSNIYISPAYEGDIKSVEIENIKFSLVPFVKPSIVRAYCSEYEKEKINSYTDALKYIIDKIEIDENMVNILIGHQFVTGAIKSDSEDISVGGTDNVDGNIFEKFDYIALGHIHRSQKVLFDKMRYSGTLLKYSFAESKHRKTLTIVDVESETKKIDISEIELKPLRDLREIKGKYMDITDKSYYENTNTDDYIHITLTDEEDIIDGIVKLRTIYPNIMKLDYDNTRTKMSGSISNIEYVESKTPFELFADLYNIQNNDEMTKEQQEYVKSIIEKVWEEKV